MSADSNSAKPLPLNRFLPFEIDLLLEPAADDTAVPHMNVHFRSGGSDPQTNFQGSGNDTHDISLVLANHATQRPQPALPMRKSPQPARVMLKHARLEKILRTTAAMREDSYYKSFSFPSSALTEGDESEAHSKLHGGAMRVKLLSFFGRTASRCGERVGPLCVGGRGDTTDAGWWPTSYLKIYQPMGRKKNAL